MSGTGFGPSLLTLDGMMSDIVGLVGGARRLFDRDRYCEVWSKHNGGFGDETRNEQWPQQSGRRMAVFKS